MVVDAVVIHFKRTIHSQKHKSGYIAIAAGGSRKSHNDDLSVSVLGIFISFIVFMYADLSILCQVLDCSIGLPCVAWSSAANTPKARTEEESRAVWRWAAYSTPN